MTLFTQITLCIAGKTVDIVLCICFYKKYNINGFPELHFEATPTSAGFCDDLIHADYFMYYRKSRSHCIFFIYKKYNVTGFPELHFEATPRSARVLL